MSSLSAKSLHHPSVCQFKNKPLSFNSSQHQEEPIKQGFLWKKGNLRKNWKKRWFVLHFNALAYFEKADSKDVLGVIPLEDCVIESEADEITGHRYSIILFSIERDFYVHGSSEANVLEWLLAINKSILQHKNALISNPKNTQRERKLFLNSLKEYFVENRQHFIRNKQIIETTKTNILGTSLEILLKHDGTDDIPYVYSRLIDYLSTCITTVGLFGMLTENEQLLALKDSFETGENVDFTSNSNPHVAASLLKLFLQSLPEPLATYDLYTKWLACASVIRKDEDDFIDTLQKIVQQLPFYSRNLFGRLCELLYYVDKNSSVNQMNAEVLSTIFSPFFFRSYEDDGLGQVRTNPSLLKLTSILIENYQPIFQLKKESLVNKKMRLMQSGDILLSSNETTPTDTDSEEEEDELMKRRSSTVGGYILVPTDFNSRIQGLIFNLSGNSYQADQNTKILAPDALEELLKKASELLL